MTEAIRAYWFCREDMTSPYAPDERWEIGQTRELEGEITPCIWGFHGSLTPWDALEDGTGPVLCLIELSGTVVFDLGNVAASKKTFVAAVNLARELRLYAADCAERVLPIWEARYPDDMRPREAIQAARDYAHGLIDAEELEARARAAEAAAAAARGAAEGAWEASYAASLAAARDAAEGAWEASSAASLAAELAVPRPEMAETWPRAEFERRFGNLFEGVGA